MQMRDLRGQKFDRLYVLPDKEPRRYGKMKHLQWLCRCDCGNEKYIRSSSLIGGSIRSCGCLLKEPKLPIGESMVTRVYHSYKKSAEKRGYEFSITKEDVRKIIFNSCHYCGSEPSMVARKHRENQVAYNGIDRANNSMGYTPNNCVPCCSLCNSMKEKLTVDEFISHVIKIRNYQEMCYGASYQVPPMRKLS